MESFLNFLKEYEDEHSYKGWGNTSFDDVWTSARDDYSKGKESFGAKGSHRDDFFLDAYGGGSSSSQEKVVVKFLHHKSSNHGIDFP